MNREFDMDRRQAKTQQSIRGAFSTLMQTKRYSEITVQDILNEANVGRSTFYEHFKTKDELLHAVCSDIFSHVFCTSLSPEKHHDFSNTNDFKHIVTHLFYHFYEDKDEIKGILRSEGKEIFINDLKNNLNELVFDYVLKVYRCAEFPEDLLVNHLIMSLTELTLWWMNRNCPESPEQMSEYYFGLNRAVAPNVG